MDLIACRFLATFALAAAATSAHAQVAFSEVSTLAGPNTSTRGLVDGTGSSARFDQPHGMAINRAGDLFVAEPGNNNAIRRVTTAGVVTTFAGGSFAGAYLDGTGLAARFSGPEGLAIDAADNVYVADRRNHVIRKITPAGVVSTLAGTPGVAGFADGTGAAAKFSSPNGIAVNAAGVVYVADLINDVIRQITPAGEVSTLAGAPGVAGFVDGTGGAARFTFPAHLAIDAAGDLYVTEGENINSVRKVTAAGVVTTLAGLAGASGAVDGTGSAARFASPRQMVVGPDGFVYVSDAGNNLIRAISPAGEVTTVVGSTTPPLGVVDGPIAEARLSNPSGLAFDAAGNLYIAETDFSHIRKATRSVGSGAPVITKQPMDQRVSPMATVQFDIIATSSPVAPLIYQWERSPAGTATWSPLSEGSTYTGVTTDHVSVHGTTLAMNGDRFRCVVSNGVPPDAISDAATLTVALASQTITFPGPSDHTYGDPPFALGATASSGLPVSYTIVSGPATAASGAITLTGAGVVTVRASQSGDGAYDAAPDVDRSFTVAPAPATIVLGALAQTYAGVPRPVTATTTPAGLAVNITYAGASVAPVNAGSYAIIATITEANYAGTASDTLVVAPAPLMASADDKTRVEGLANPPLTISYAGFVAGETTAVLDTLPTASTTADTSSPTGTYSITLTGGADNNYAITRTDGTLTVVANTGIAISGYPESVTVLPDDEARFEVELALLPGVVPEFRWQRSLDGGSNWTEVVADANHSGVTTAALVVRGTRTTMVGWDYRVIVSDGDVHPTATSNPAHLNVFNVVTRAGSTLEPGSVDGPADVARFSDIRSIAIDAAGNAYIADTTAHTVRKITPAGIVSTLAGLAGSSGSADGVGSTARFGDLEGIAVTADGLVFVADTSNFTIRMIAPDGAVTTIAGSAGLRGSSDGPAATARFDSPRGIAVNNAGDVLVADGATLRRISSDAVVSSVYPWREPVRPAEGPRPPAELGTITCVETDEAGYVYVGGAGSVHRIAPDGRTVKLAGGADEPYSDGRPGGLGIVLTLTVDRSGYVYISDAMGGETAIRRISPSGVVTTMTSRDYGYRDGLAAGARVSYPADLAVDERGRVQFVDTGNLVVRTLGFDPAAPVVAAFPESVVGVPQRSVTFTCDVAGVPWVTHQWQRSVDGGATWGELADDETYFGSRSAVLTVTGVTRWMEGHRFRDTATYDTGSSVTSAVATLTVAQGYSFLTYAGAGVPGVDTPSFGRGDLVGLDLSGPITTDAAGGLYFAGYGQINHVSADGYVSPVWTGPGYNLWPNGLAVGSAGDLLIANSVPPLNYPDLGSETAFIMRRTALGEISLVAGGALGSGDGLGLAAGFTGPQGVAVAAGDVIFVADTDAATVRRIAPTGEVTTFAGSAYETGTSDGVGAGARFSAPAEVAVDGLGTVYVVDRGAALIRKITPAGLVTTWAGGGGAEYDADAVGTAASFYSPAGIAVDASGNAFVTDEGGIVRRIAPDGWVTTIGGAFATFESVDGFGTQARFELPAGITIDAFGRLFITDAGKRIRLGVFNAHEAIITTSPADAVTVPGGDVTFSVGIDGTRPIRVTWQRSDDDGRTWTEAGTDAIYTATSTATFTLSSESGDLNGVQVRATASNGLGAAAVSRAAVIGTESSEIYSGEFSPPPAGIRAARNLSTQAISAGGDWALHVRPDRSALFLAYLPQRSSALVASFTVAPDGSFSVDGVEQRSAGLPPQSYRLVGQITAGLVSGQIDAFGLSFAGTAHAASGPAAGSAGRYSAPALYGASGSSTAIVAADGSALVVVVANGQADGGTGLVTDAGAFLIDLSSGAIASGTTGGPGGLEMTLTRPAGGPAVMFVGAGDGATAANQLVNLSTRSFVGDGDEVAIAGFVLQGSGTRSLLMRVVGPTLETLPAGVTGALTDPQLEVFDQANRPLVKIDNWGRNGDAARIMAAMGTTGAFLLPAGSADAALVADLPAGRYTMIASGVSGARGVALAELYTLDPAGGSAPRLINISTRGFVGAGDAVLIPGFISEGNVPRRYLVRAVGPTLSAFNVAGVLADPVLAVHRDGLTEPVAENDDWDLPDGVGDETATLAQQVGAFALPRGSADAALVLTIPPGVAHTVVVSGRNGAPGVALAEVYEIP